MGFRPTPSSLFYRQPTKEKLPYIYIYTYIYIYIFKVTNKTYKYKQYNCIIQIHLHIHNFKQMFVLYIHYSRQTRGDTQDAYLRGGLRGADFDARAQSWIHAILVARKQAWLRPVMLASNILHLQVKNGIDHMGRFINCLDRQRSPGDRRRRGYINK